MTSLFRRLSVAALALSLLGSAQAARPPAARWERIPVTRVLPSQVLAHIGLTHYTRLGYTRDGAKKGDPDPTFPPGLMDVVPQDREHILLVRGTGPGLLAFRAEVAGAEAQILAPRWHVQAELLQTRNGQPTPAAPAWTGDLPDDTPTPIALPGAVIMLGAVYSSQEEHLYQVRVRPTVPGTLTVQWQRGLHLFPVSGARNVAVASVAWSPIETQTVAPGGSIVFTDEAAGRAISRAVLGLPADPYAADFVVRLTITPLAPAPPPPVGGNLPPSLRSTPSL